ncbi:MAG TPA: choice-of-anchor D domain-containing protein, partial [Candidatus Syntrophosphaera sp.]|nr:choice-of-anchor D domain-containing protein [Candidatus Syntrophosphaera sp.]
ENESYYDASNCGFFCTPTPAPRGLLYYSDSNNPDPATPPTASYMRNYLANLAVVSGPLPLLAPLTPILMWPENGATGLPLAGVDLAWRPELNGGGLPDNYGVYLSHDPDPAANPLHYAVTADMHYDPVSQGGLSFAFEEDWYWTVKAFKTGLPDSPNAAPNWFEVIGSPPEIAADPASLNQSQDHGLATTQTLTITNDGGLPLDYALGFTNTTAGETALWCWSDPIQGSIPRHDSAAVTIHYDASLLEPGTYTGYFSVTHNAPASPTLEIPVQLTVTGSWPAEFVLQPTGHDFGEVEQLNPVTAQFAITNSGGSVPAPLMIPAGGVFLAYQAELNFSLQAPGLPVSLAHGQSFNFQLTFTPQTLGAKSATLLIMDNLGRNIYTAVLTGTGITEDIGSIVNLQAEIQNNTDIVLTWIMAPGTPGEPGWLHYDSGSNNTAIGDGTSTSYAVAMKLPIASVAPYAGMQIKHIKYYPCSASTAYTLKIWTGEEEDLAPSTVVYSQADTPTANAWNDVTLSTPYWITGTTALWIGYEAVVPSPSDNYYPLGCDAGPAVAGYGDLLYYGGFWASMLSYYGINYNWNIQAYVEAASAKAPQAPPLSIPVVNAPPDWDWLHEHPLLVSENTNPPERAVQGFNVFRNDIQINTELVPTTTYTDYDMPNGTYVYTVQAVYYTALSAPSAPVTVALEYYPPYDLPFVEDWESGSLATHHWQTAVPNWVPYTIGNPGFGLVFQYSPTQQNYGESAVSHLMNGIGFASVNLGFDMAMSNYSTGAENWMAAEVFDGSGWVTLATWSSFMNSGGGMPWTHFDYDISPYAAEREFQIRFRAYGVNSWYIN